MQNLLSESHIQAKNAWEQQRSQQKDQLGAFLWHFLPFPLHSGKFYGSVDSIVPIAHPAKDPPAMAPHKVPANWIFRLVSTPGAVCVVTFVEIRQAGHARVTRHHRCRAVGRARGRAATQLL